jgi:hypothetical protein
VPNCACSSDIEDFGSADPPVDLLRLKEVLRYAAQKPDLQPLFVRRGDLDSGPNSNAEVLCGPVAGNKNPRFPGISSLPKPSDGLEPSTPSLPFRAGGNPEFRS